MFTPRLSGTSPGPTIDPPFHVKHWRDAPDWWGGRWPNFHPREIACRHCGAILIDPPALDALQAARSVGARTPLTILSGYRCPVHNALVGGAPRSMHLYGKAFDLRTTVAERYDHRLRALTGRFTGFGYYRTFLHIDMGRTRSWGSWAA